MKCNIFDCFPIRNFCTKLQLEYMIAKKNPLQIIKKYGRKCKISLSTQTNLLNATAHMRKHLYHINVKLHCA